MTAERWFIICCTFTDKTFRRCLCDLVSTVLDHRSLPPVLESRPVHIWRVFHLWLRFITFGIHSAHLAYRVHKGGRKTLIINQSTDKQKFTICIFTNNPTYLCNHFRIGKMWDWLGSHRITVDEIIYLYLSTFYGYLI